MRYTRWILSFSLSFSLSRAGFSLSQAAAGREENAEEEEAQDVKGVKETERRRRGDAGREIRKELSSLSSSADCKASMRHNKNREAALL
jgi:hypothetical protein